MEFRSDTQQLGSKLYWQRVHAICECGLGGSYDRNHPYYDSDPVFRNGIQWRLGNHGNDVDFDDRQSGDCYFSGHGTKAPQVFEGK